MSPKKPFDLLFLVVALGVLFSVLVNDIKDRFDFLLTGREPLPYPQPYWEPARIATPGFTLGMKIKNELPVGSDFLQVYLAGKALRLGQSAYEPEDLNLQDPFNRRPNYPPFVNWLYLPLSQIYYPYALAIHSLITLGLFFTYSAYILWREKLLRQIWKVFAIYTLLYFYTPLGYSHFEKGQFDLYAAAASLLPIIAIARDSLLGYALATGFFAAFKWSALPFLGSFGAFAFFTSPARKRWYFIIPLGVVVLSILLFWTNFLDYLPSLRQFELNVDHPIGLSFWHLMPKPLAKSFQIGCLFAFTAIFFYFSKKEQRPQELEVVSVPFGLAMLAQGLCFGSISLEYRVLTMLGMVVPLIVWAEKVDISEKTKIALAVSVGVFLVIIFRNFEFLPFMRFTEAQMTTIFLVFSLFSLGIAIYLVITRGHKSAKSG